MLKSIPIIFFLFFKNHFWYQHIKKIQKVQTALNFSKKKKKIQICQNAGTNAAPNGLLVYWSLGYIIYYDLLYTWLVWSYNSYTGFVITWFFTFLFNFLLKYKDSEKQKKNLKYIFLLYLHHFQCIFKIILDLQIYFWCI